MKVALEAAAVPRAGFVVREATKRDIPDINRLFAVVFGRERETAATTWRLFDNPAGEAVVTVVEKDGCIIAQRAFWPIWIGLGSERVLGAQSIDLMVHPDFQGKGVFRFMALASFRSAERRGIEVLYGFPNCRALRASHGLGWNEIGRVCTFTRPLRSDAFSRLPLPFHPVMSLALRVWPKGSTRHFDVQSARPDAEAVQALLPRRSPSGTRACETERSPEWYNWRFARKMEGRYEWVSVHTAGQVVGFAVWGRSPDGRTARLAEVIGASEGAISAAIAGVIDHAAQAECSAVDAMTNRTDVLRALAHNGFRKSGDLVFRVKNLARRSLPPFESFAQWRLLGSDFDVY